MHRKTVEQLGYGEDLHTARVVRVHRYDQKKLTKPISRA